MEDNNNEYETSETPETTNQEMVNQNTSNTDVVEISNDVPDDIPDDIDFNGNDDEIDSDDDENSDMLDSMSFEDVKTPPSPEENLKIYDSDLKQETINSFGISKDLINKIEDICSSAFDQKGAIDELAVKIKELEKHFDEQKQLKEEMELLSTRIDSSYKYVVDINSQLNQYFMEYKQLMQTAQNDIAKFKNIKEEIPKTTDEINKKIYNNFVEQLNDLTTAFRKELRNYIKGIEKTEVGYFRKIFLFSLNTVVAGAFIALVVALVLQHY